MLTQPLEIYQLGSDVLRLVASNVESILSSEIQALIDQMIFTCKASKGVGIAAPQVNISKAIMIMASSPNARYPDAPHMEPLALINPRIISHSKSMSKDWEGCLSLPGIRGMVPRYDYVETLYFDRYGNEHKVTFQGFLARIFQHEYDHLIGKVFIDRVESTTDIIMEKEYIKRITT